MKISELIGKLLEIMMEHGNLEIHVGFEGINMSLEDFGMKVIDWGEIYNCTPKKVLWLGD
jgi:hypothetical protein